MSQLPSVNQPAPNSDPSAAATVDPAFETKVQAFWDRNQRLILTVCVLVLLGIIGREAWQYFSAMRERGIKEEYAKISGTPEKLAAFAEANASHALAGIALLQVADQKFEAGNYKESAAAYNKAAGTLENAALLGRARLGAAMSQINGGEKATGEAALKALGDDQNILKSVRAEANYHLATIAYENGNSDEVKKRVEEITKLDLNGAWSQRGTMLLATLEAGSSAETATPAVTFKTGGN